MPFVLLLALAAQIQLGPNASLGGRRPFPDDNPWNRSVAALAVDPRSDTYIRTIGADRPLHPDFGASWRGAPFGIPYVVVAGSQPRVPVDFDYADESDREPYPVPPDPPIERGDDRHILIIDRDAWRLYELYLVEKRGGGWHAGSGAIFDLGSNKLRPEGWTSADAAGLPIFPGLVRRDEVVEQRQIRHALRFTVRRTRRAFIPPARHQAGHGDDPALPPMGLRLRLKASFDVSGYPPDAQVILKALKEYGMILADNGGDWYLSGTADARWDDAQIETLKRVKGGDFEVVSSR